MTANFKETQLKEMRVGPGGDRSTWTPTAAATAGKVDSIAAATGARFSLLPPENATGNYVKVVQRVPVKIVLDQGQDREHLLRPGMSVVATVHIRQVIACIMTVADEGRAPAERQATHPWIVAISVMFGTFMVVLDTTVVNVSLPHIAGSLSASIEETTWALTLVPRRERDHPADHRVAGELRRPPTPAAASRWPASPRPR